MSHRQVTDRIVVLGTCLVMAIVAPGTTSAGPQVLVRDVEESKEAAGTLTALTPEQLTLAGEDGAVWQVPRRNLRFVSTLPSPADPEPQATTAARWWVLLTNGDCLFAGSLGVSEDRLDVHRTGGAAPDLRIPLEFVRGCVHLSGDNERDAVEVRRIQRVSTATDVLHLENSDRLPGEIVRWDERGCRFRFAGGEVTIPDSRIRTVQYNAALATLPAAIRDWVLVQLSDGSRLSALAVQLDAEAVEIRHAAELQWKFSISSVARLDFFGERVQAVSRMPPARFESRPVLAPGGSFAVDFNVDGGPLSLAGINSPWGLGVSSGSRLVWDLTESWQRFETIVGLDASVGTGGSVDFVLRIDGREVQRSGVRTGRDPPLELHLDLMAGARQLELIVEPADRGDILDSAVWLRPTLLR